jgi:hypothetical protein
MMDSIEAASPQLLDEFRNNFGALVILDEIARVIRNRTVKGRALIL